MPIAEIPSRLRRLSWCAAVACLMGAAMYCGCAIARNRVGCAVAAGAVMVLLAGAIVARLSY